MSAIEKISLDQTGLLRFITAGSVDDGKSTLIGRLLHDFRGYMGRIESGSVWMGDAVTVLPSDLSSRIKEILVYEGSVTEAFAPQSVTLTIEDHLDISRGDMLVRVGDSPQVTKVFDAMLCWLSEQPLE